MAEEIVYSKELEIINNELLISVEKDGSVYNDINTFLNGASKRIRSILGILYLKTHSIKFSEYIIQILIAGEIIHNASLLHDDVIDGAIVRRNQETLAHKFSPHISILTGDYLLSLAVEHLLKVNDVKVLEVFLKCTQKMSEAEILQYKLRHKNVTLEEYISICEGKTSGLFEAILESIAIVSGLDNSIAKTIGKNFGLIFQIKNYFYAFSIFSGRICGSFIR